MKTPRISDDQFIQFVKESYSLAQVMKKMNLKPTGGSYLTVPKRIKDLGLDTSHFTGMVHNKGKTYQPKRLIEDYLNNIVGINSHSLRLRLIKERIFDHECSECHNTVWMSKPIPLQLDHINGIHDDNTLSNLRLLCPNCHAQTDNYCGKNIKINRKVLHPRTNDLVSQEAISILCVVCGDPVRNKKRSTCSHSCSMKHKPRGNHDVKQDWDNIDLAGLYTRFGSALGIAKHLGNVSDTSVRKQMRKRGII